MKDMLIGIPLIAVGVLIWCGGTVAFLLLPFFPELVLWHVKGGGREFFISYSLCVQTASFAAGGILAWIGIRIMDHPLDRRALYLSCAVAILAMTAGRFAFHLFPLWSIGYLHWSSLLFVLDTAIAAFFLRKSFNP